MQPETRKHLFDIINSIHSIYEFLGPSRDFNSFRDNKMLRRAVEREFEIIGEAMSRILKTDPEVHIEEARKIVDLRNWVIHVYDKVDDVIIWGIISKDLPRLKAQVEKLLPE